MLGPSATNWQLIAWVIGGSLLVVALVCVAIRIVRFLLKLVLGLAGLALVAGAVWWFFLRN